MNFPRTRGTTVVLYDVERDVTWWVVVARAWHCKGRCARVTSVGSAAPWRVVADARREVRELGGERMVNARVLTVTR